MNKWLLRLVRIGLFSLWAGSVIGTAILYPVGSWYFVLAVLWPVLFLIALVAAGILVSIGMALWDFLWRGWLPEDPPGDF